MYKGWHDIGGEDAKSPIDRTQHNYQYWEKQVDTLPGLLLAKKLINLHIFRRYIESLEPLVYTKSSYFEKWAVSITKCLLETNVFTLEELDVELGITADTTQVLYKPGTRVTVLEENLQTRWQKPHLRTPGYIYGKTGTIERVCGSFNSPEMYAFLGRKQTQQPLYRVSFLQRDVWSDYSGKNTDIVELEVYQNWLRTAEDQQQKQQQQQAHVADTHKDHDHHDDHVHDHVHEQREHLEQTAVDSEGPESPYALLANALLRLLVKKKHSNKATNTRIYRCNGCSDR